MNSLIIKNKDVHTVRLITGLQSCGIEVDVISSPQSISKKYDMIFIDPSVSFDINNLDYNYLFFFDSEDSTNHFDPGLAYDKFKDKVSAYVKYNYEVDDRKDGIRNIAMPLSHYLKLSNIASYNYSSNDTFTPYILTSPTFIGNYKPNDGIYNKTEDINCIGKFTETDWMYNQRYDWILSLRKNNIKYNGGIVFSQGNLSLEWQTKYFGNVNKLRSFPVSHEIMLYNLIKNKIGLCPTGHERISWRLFDIMATGAILILTDTKKKLALFNPKEYITIQDGQDLGTELLKYYPLFKDIHRHHQANRELFKNLTPDKLIQIFLNQLK